MDVQVRTRVLGVAGQGKAPRRDCRDRRGFTILIPKPDKDSRAGNHRSHSVMKRRRQN